MGNHKLSVILACIWQEHDHGGQEEMNRCWVLSKFISYLGPGDSEAVESLEDGVVSGGFEIAGAATARRCGDIGVRGIKSDSKVKIARASATDVILDTC